MPYQIGLLKSAWTQDGLRRFRWNPELAGHDDELAVGDVVQVTTQNHAKPVDDFEIVKIEDDYVYGHIRFIGTIAVFKEQLDGDTIDPEIVEPAIRENLGDQGFNAQEIDQIIDALTGTKDKGGAFKGLRETVEKVKAETAARVDAIVPVLAALVTGEIDEDEAADQLRELDATLSELQLALAEVDPDGAPTDAELVEMMRVRGSEAIGEQVRRLRNEAGMKQEEVADAAGLAQGRLSEYERGERSPSADVLERLAGVLGPITIR